MELLIELQSDRRVTLPKQFCKMLGLETGTKVAVRCTKDGIIICKAGIFSDLDTMFEKVNNDVKHLLGNK